MISLITGGPGTGKTAWLVSYLKEMRSQEKKQGLQPRELFIHGVRNLRGIAHETIYCKSQLCDICRAVGKPVELPEGTKFVENWPDWKTQGALIVVDEVQRIWRPRTGGSPMPVGVSALETHRHYGVDLILISQGPHLFDNAIRLLVGKHVHLVLRWSGRTEYEWPECKQDVQSRSDAVTRPYKLPSHVYKMYDSAEIHTKTEKRKPLAFYAVIGLLVLAVVLVGFAVSNIGSRVSPKTSAEPTALAGGSASTSVSTIVDVSTPEKLTLAMTPVVVGVPWSAPIYKKLVEPVSFPKVVGCIKSMKKDDDRCSCFTQQGTLAGVPRDVCLIYVQHRAFDHFKPDLENRQNDQINVAQFVPTK